MFSMMKSDDGSTNCKFCRIYEKDKHLVIHETENTFSFHDIKKGSAKEHLLVCPKQHIKHMLVLTKEDIPLLLEMKQAAIEVGELVAKGHPIM